jgi:hypothetical protein
MRDLEWIGPEAATVAALNFGAYSVRHPGSNLRIISFNTMFYMKENFWLYTPITPWASWPPKYRTCTGCCSWPMSAPLLEGKS